MNQPPEKSRARRLAPEIWIASCATGEGGSACCSYALLFEDFSILIDADASACAAFDATIGAVGWPAGAIIFGDRGLAERSLRGEAFPPAEVVVYSAALRPLRNCQPGHVRNAEGDGWLRRHGIAIVRQRGAPDGAVGVTSKRHGALFQSGLPSDGAGERSETLPHAIDRVCRRDAPIPQVGAEATQAARRLGLRGPEIVTVRTTPPRRRPARVR